MSGTIRYHTDLDVWNCAIALAKAAYSVVANFPPMERFSLADQVRRAAASVPANIAEGCGRGTTQEFIRSLRIARGSLCELHSHLSLAAELSYIDSGEPIFRQIERVQLLVNRLIGSLAKIRR